MNHLSKAFLMLGFGLFLAVAAEAKTLIFSGFEWTVRGSGYGAPGKNYWRSDNVWLDELGRLHLAIRKIDGKWTCAELSTTRKFLYGKYSFKVIGRLDQLDRNVVLGLFNYPVEPAKQGLGEIDIEFARWGNPGTGNGNFTVWSDKVAGRSVTKSFPFDLTGTYTRHDFTRTAQSVFFQSFYGHTEKNEIFRWNYTGTDVSATPMPIYLNFWLFRGLAPSDGRDAEIVVSEVSYLP
ncbi:MAG: glycoside hydrolase family 16 protein [Acidobacteria bacterium]|nr:glycoside hydrolase family 16 protein [Acidobacteriota bacterium]